MARWFAPTIPVLLGAVLNLSGIQYPPLAVLLWLAMGGLVAWVYIWPFCHWVAGNNAWAANHRVEISVCSIVALLVLWCIPIVVWAPWAGPARTPPVKLYYGDKELTWLNGPITLERGCSPVSCMRMHLWPWPNPEHFGLYGIWIEKPAHVPPFGTNGNIYLEFSEVVAEKNNWCRQQSPEALHAGYKIALICAGSPQTEGAAWILPKFNFVPIPRAPLSVRVALEYGDIVSVPAEFTLLPPGN